MEYRQLGRSGLRVSALSFGTATFGGGSDYFKAWGSTQVEEATKLVNICIEAGITMFDTADSYSGGLAEQILGKALKGERDNVLISTKATFPTGSPNDEGTNNMGSSRYHLIKACENSLKRLQTDHIDVYHMHRFDATTPVQETLRALEDLVESGKVRYIACSNFSGWNLMKSLSISDRYGWNPYISHQVYYSLLNREYEWELMPLALDQQLGAVIWSGLAEGRLSGKYRRDQAPEQNTRVTAKQSAMTYPDERLYKIVDMLDEIAQETGKTIAQISLNWLLQRPTISSVRIGARNEEQLRQNLGAIGWKLSAEQIKRLDIASDTPLIYPYWHQHQQTPELNASPIFYKLPDECE